MEISTSLYSSYVPFIIYKNKIRIYIYIYKEELMFWHFFGIEKFLIAHFRTPTLSPVPLLRVLPRRADAVGFRLLPPGITKTPSDASWDPRCVLLPRHSWF